MGNTEEEQAEAMKHYIREVFIPEYTKNFNKELSASDIKFYGKIHFDRNHSDNELNMHCHLIVSRKDQSNKKKLSPLTNHKDTKKGMVTAGFNHVNLFQQAEQGFDKLFNYNRQQMESFDYHNTIKNRSIYEQLKQQEQEIQFSERKPVDNQDSNQENLFSINIENKKVNNQTLDIDNNKFAKQVNCATTTSFNNQNKSQALNAVVSITTSCIEISSNKKQSEEDIPKLLKRKKKSKYRNI